MKQLLFVWLGCMLAFAYGKELVGTCVRVADGDTCVVLVEGDEVTVRLVGIDAPEGQQVGGRESKQYLTKRILNKKVRVQGNKKDRYGRFLGTVYVGSENINLSMVRRGLAWDYKYFSAGAVYTQAEQEARAQKCGIWGAQEAPLPPWEFRHAKRFGKVEEAAAARESRNSGDFEYWVSNSGKTHNRSCSHFLKNTGSGYYSNTPSSIDAKCCGGARGKR